MTAVAQCHAALRMLASCFAFALVLLAPHSATARPLDEVMAAKSLRVVVYRDNPPFSYMDGDEAKGIDVDIGRAVAKQMGIDAEIIARAVGEDVDDDLRFNVWKGPYSEGGVGDVMLHVPVDRELMSRNPLAAISNAYFTETVALAVDPERIKTAESFDVFTQHKIGVQYATVADYFLLRYGDGKLINNISHYTKLEKGVAEFLKKDTAAILGVRSDIEGMLHKAGGTAAFLDTPMPGLVRQSWLIGTAVKENSRDLGYAIGKALQTLSASGEMEAIFKAHGVTYTPPLAP
jgi:polar amino acid transport system substrate-binding protein